MAGSQHGLENMDSPTLVSMTDTAQPALELMVKFWLLWCFCSLYCYVSCLSVKNSNCKSCHEVAKLNCNCVTAVSDKEQLQYIEVKLWIVTLKHRKHLIFQLPRAGFYLYSKNMWQYLKKRWVTSVIHLNITSICDCWTSNCSRKAFHLPFHRSGICSHSATGA